MAGEFDLVFNSGATETRYTEGDNISLIEINHSDQDYYQTGMVTTFDLPSQTVGDDVIIIIDDSNQFYGYIARRQQEIRGGKKHITYQLVGKTYDLWRYNTGTNSTHSGYTAQIAYDLISSNCPGISGNDITLTDGLELTNEIDFSNTKVGDALVTLIGYDGYKFYVNENDELQYYKQETRLYDFTIEEDDILDMSPIEEADEDLVNDVLVIGGSDYSVKDEVSMTHPSSTVVPYGVWVAQRFTANDYTLKSLKMYLGRSIGDDSPSTLEFEIWENAETLLFDDDFDNEDYIDNTYNMTINDSNLELEYTSSPTYPSDGVTSSNIYTQDCQYMKVTLTDVISSNHIKISGTNDNGITWKTLTDGQWVNLDSESSDGTFVKYIFSSNNNFTPKIGNAKLEICDANAGFDEEVFDDSFTSDTNFSSQSRSYITLHDEVGGDDQLMLSGNAGQSQWKYADSVDLAGGWAGIWRNPDNLLAGAGICDILAGAAPYDGTITFSFDEKKVIDAIRMRSNIHRADFEINKIEISTSVADWFEVRPASARNYGYWDSLTQYTKKYWNLDNASYPDGCVYSGVRKVRMYGETDEMHVIYGRLNFSYFQFRERPIFLKGSLKTNNFTIGSGVDFGYLLVEPIGVTYDSSITYSGSLDSGANWTKLDANANTTISDTGKNVVLWYNISPYGVWPDGKVSSSTISPDTPIIESCKLTASYTAAGGIPNSGTKLEWSDQVSWTDGDVPYQPNWSEWQSYSDPKLSGLTIGNDYWLILYHNSANSAYWEYYYDPKSTYAGKIAYSWYGDEFKTKWSSNSQLPTVVSPGSISFQLGWREGEITATAINQDSIDTYGRHSQIINDSTINTSELAQAKADAEVSGMQTIPKKGTITIDGRTDMETYYRFSSNLTNFGIDDIWDVVSYTQSIGPQGFITTINYGKQPFDIMKVISDLET